MYDLILQTKFIKELVEKILEKVIRDKLEKSVTIRIETVEVTSNEDTVTIHVDAKGALYKKDLLALLMKGGIL